ncbi:MAG: hypothetical protein AAF735_04715 [Myxococcota bacterium]
MRTTLDIADDVLLAAKEAAKRQKTTAGRIISDWARQSLTAKADEIDQEPVCGFRPFNVGRQVVSNATVEELRQDGPY